MANLQQSIAPKAGSVLAPVHPVQPVADAGPKPLSPIIDVPARPAEGVGFKSVTPLAGFAPDRMKDVHSTVPEGLDLDKTLAVIRRQETGSFDGDYAKAGHPGRTASGAYQFVDRTWKSLTGKYGIGKEYPSASAAPPEVQDAVAKNYVMDLYRKYDGDMDKVYNTHFTGNARGRMSAVAMAANKGLTSGGYLNAIRSHEADYDARKMARR